MRNATVRQAFKLYARSIFRPARREVNYAAEFFFALLESTRTVA